MNPRPALIVLTALAFLGQVHTAQGQSSLRAIDNTLTLRPGIVAAISRTEITLHDGRETIKVPLADIVAFVPPTWIDGSSASAAIEPALWTIEQPGSLSGVLETTSGEVLPGTFAEGDPAADTLTWISPTLGTIALPLDVLNRINFGASAPADRTEHTSDILTLLNGDRIEGFVTRLGKSVTIEGQAAPIPLERIASIDLANPTTPQTSPLLWCRDGTVFAADALLWPGLGEATASRGSNTASLRASNIRSVNLHPSSLIPLASLPQPTWSAASSRRWTPNPAAVESATGLGASPIRLPGPGVATWSLPPGATRLSATLELPADCRAWGNPTITISVTADGSKKQLWQGTLDRSSPTVEFNDVLPTNTAASTLEVAISAGPRGDIQNEVTLRNALVLLK